MKQLYQYPSTIDSRSSDIGGFLDAGVSLVADEGLNGLSMRKLADRSATSPSTIANRFRSKRALIAEVERAVRSRQDGIWQDRRALLPRQPMDPSALASLALGLLLDDAYHHADTLRARWVFDVHRLRLTASRGATSSASEPDQEFRTVPGEPFWQDALASSGADPALARNLAHTLASIGQIMLVTPPTTPQIAWCSETLIRLFERVFGKARKGPRDSLWRAQIAHAAERPDDENRQGPSADTRKRIIDTAAILIREKGYQALSHRLIARQGGIALSSTTHHFASLDEIILEAFWSVYESATDTVRALEAASRPESLSGYIEEALPAFSSDARASNTPMIVSEELILRSSQREDMRALGLALLARMGETTASLLAPLSAQNRFTRLDAHIFRHALRGVALHSGSTAHTLGHRESADFLKAIFVRNPAPKGPASGR